MSKSLAIAGIVLAALVLTASLVSPLSTDVGRLLERSAEPSAGGHDHAAVQDAGRLTRTGDEIHVHVTLFDAEGGILLSTDERRANNLSEARNASGELFVLPSAYQAMRHTLTDGAAPTRLSDNVSLLIGDALLGKPVGGRALVPVVGTFEGYVRHLSLERMNGPYNLTLETPNGQLKNLTTSEDGSRIRLDDVLDAEVLERKESTTVYRLLLEDGARLPVRGTELSAEVVFTPEGDQFFFRLHAEEGTTFSLLKRCSFVKSTLAKGSYRVESVNDETVELAWSYTKFPQIMERELSALIEIVDFKGDAAPGGDH